MGHITWPHSYQGQFVIRRLRLAHSTCTYIAYFRKIKETTSQWPRPIQGQFVVRRLGLAVINMYTKFEVSSLSRSRDTLGDKKFKMGHLTWPRPSQRLLLSVGWELRCSTHVLNLKCLRLPAAMKWKFWKATPNVKILVFSHPLGDLGVTHRVHLRLNGKRVVDFLLAIIVILASSLGCGTIKRNLSKSAFSEGVGHFELKY